MTIVINGREFQVEQHPTQRGMTYLLRGKRGAIYGTIRHSCGKMFLMSLSRLMKVDPLGRIWLTDENGALECCNV